MRVRKEWWRWARGAKVCCFNGAALVRVRKVNPTQVPEIGTA